MRLLDWSALLLLALLWGMSFMLVELALPSFAPATLVFARVALAALLMAAVLLARCRPSSGLAPAQTPRALAQLLAANWRVYALLGFFGSAFPFFCFSWGQQAIDSGLAGVLNALTPLIITAIALAKGWETFSAIRVGGIALGFIGVSVLLRPQTDGGEWFGMLACIVAAASYAVATSIAWARLSRNPPLENAAGQLLFASLYTLPFALAEAPWRADFTPLAVGALLSLSLFSTFFAYLVYYFLLRRAGGVNATLAIFLLPFVAVILGRVFLSEQFGGAFYAGSALILIGILLTDASLRKTLKNLIMR